MRRSSLQPNYKPLLSINPKRAVSVCRPPYLSKGPFEVISTKPHWIQLLLISSVIWVRQAVKWQHGRQWRESGLERWILCNLNTCNSGWLLTYRVFPALWSQMTEAIDKIGGGKQLPPVLPPPRHNMFSVQPSLSFSQHTQRLSDKYYNEKSRNTPLSISLTGYYVMNVNSTMADYIQRVQM